MREAAQDEIDVLHAMHEETLEIGRQVLQRDGEHRPDLGTPARNFRHYARRRQRDAPLRQGQPVTIRNPAQAVAAGFGFCPEDRKLDGIFGDLSVRENIIIALQAKLGWFKALNRDDQVELAGRYAEALDIRAADHDMPVKLLSGGNQQKVILARWLAIDPSFLILDEPTRGIDVGAHAEIVRTINRLREEGLALFVISSELDEVVAYSNRIVVMRDRQMVAELDGDSIAPDAIVQAIAGTQEAPPGPPPPDTPPPSPPPPPPPQSPPPLL